MDEPKSPPVAVESGLAVQSEILETLLDAAISRRPSVDPRPTQGVIVGTLVGFMDNGATPLVAYPGQPGTAALAARTTVDVHGAHIASEVVLLFESGDPSRPIIVGRLRGTSDRQPGDSPGRVEVDADGERLVVSANTRLVLRCGQASITLSADGRVVVRGTHVISHSSGLNRIKGGAVQIN